MFDGNFRSSFDKVAAPFAQRLLRLSISPDFLTFCGVLMAASCAAAIGFGKFHLALFLLVLTGLSDALDGAVAKASGRSSLRGAFFDSVSDRLSDGLLFAGAAWYLAGEDDPHLALLPFALYVAASLVSYERAKAESLGFEAKGGLMERAERFIVLGFGLLFSSLFIPTLWVMLVLTIITAAGRFRKVWLQASSANDFPTSQQQRRRGTTSRQGSLRERARSQSESFRKK